MSDRIAVMHAGKVEQLGHARGALRATRRPGSWRTSSARRTCSAAGSRPTGAVRLVVGRDRAVSPHDGLRGRAPRSRSASDPESISPGARATAAGAIRGTRRAGRLPRQHRLVPGPHGRRPRPHRPRAQDRDATPGRQRCRHHLAAAERARPRPAGSARHGGGPRHDRPHDGSSDRPREGADPLHGRAPDQPARSCSSAIAQARRPSRHWPRSSRRARRRAWPRPPPHRAAASAAPRRPPASAAAGAAAIASRRRRCPTPEERAVRLQLDRVHRRGHASRPSRRSTASRSHYDFFSNTDEAYAKLGSDGGGYDVSFPISVDIPDVRREGRDLSRSTSR